MYRRLPLDLNVVFRMLLFCIEQTVKYKDTVHCCQKQYTQKTVLKFLNRNLCSFSEISRVSTHIFLCVTNCKQLNCMLSVVHKVIL